MTNQYNCVLSPYINIKYDFSYLSTEIKKKLLYYQKYYQNDFLIPPFYALLLELSLNVFPSVALVN